MNLIFSSTFRQYFLFLSLHVLTLFNRMIHICFGVAFLAKSWIKSSNDISSCLSALFFLNENNFSIPREPMGSKGIAKAHLSKLSLWHRTFCFKKVLFVIIQGRATFN